MIDIYELKALADAATPGPWLASGPSFGSDKPKYLEEVLVDRAGDEDDTYTVCKAPLCGESSADMGFIAAASPSVVLELIADIERLSAECDGCPMALVAELKAENDKLKITAECADNYSAMFEEASEEIESLRKDAERYRWLRSRTAGSSYRVSGIVYSEGSYGVDAGIDEAMTNTDRPLT